MSELPGQVDPRPGVDDPFGTQPEAPTHGATAVDVLAAGSPRPRRRLGRRFALVLGGTVVVLAAVLALVAVFVVVPSWRASSPAWLAETAITQLDDVKMLRYQGTFIDDFGRSVRMDARVDRAGRAAGWQEIEGHRAEFISSSDGTYLKADAQYWNLASPESAGIYGGRWVNTGVEELRMRLSPWLEPGRLQTTLRKEFLGDVKLRKSKRKVSGSAAARITASDRAAISVSSTSPYRLAQIEGALVAEVGGRSEGGYRFEVTVPSSSERDALDARFRAIPQTMAGVPERGAPAKLPAYYVTESRPDDDDNDCDSTRCVLRATVRNLNGPSQPGQRHSLVGVITEGADLSGARLGHCQTTLASMPRDTPTEVTCVVRDPRWSSWWARSNNSYYSWTFISVNSGWDGTDASAATTLLESNPKAAGELRDVLREGGGLGLKVFARLLRYPGVPPYEAAVVVKQASKYDQLDVLDAYVSSGRVGNPAELSKFAAGLYNGAMRTYAPFTEIWQLQEAAARAKSGSGPVALWSWTPPGAKAPVGAADLLDTGRKEAVEIDSVGLPAGAAVVRAISSAATALKDAPAGYRHLVQIHVADSRNPLSSLGKRELRAALEKLGLKKAALSGVQQLVLVNGAGRHTFAPADFG